MTNELQALLDTLTAKHAWLPSVLVWIGTLRVLCKGFSNRLQLALERNIEIITNSKSVEDDARVQQILESRFYGWTAFIVDLLFSVKLPRALPVPINPNQKGPQ